MKITFFDTETTGVPHSYKLPPEKYPLCGSKLQSAELSETEVKIEDGVLLEFWNQASDVQKPKWVRVMEYDYCKQCLSALNGR